MAELPRFSSPSIWIVKVTAWSKKPFADFPGRFSGELMDKRGRDAEVSVGVSHQWVRGAATSVAPDVTGTILSGRTSQVLGRSEGHGRFCARGEASASSCGVCIPLRDHARGEGRWHPGLPQPLREAPEIPQLVLRLEQGKDFYESCFLTKKREGGKKKPQQKHNQPLQGSV